MKIRVNGIIIAEVITNKSMTIEEAMHAAGWDINDEDDCRKGYKNNVEGFDLDFSGHYYFDTEAAEMIYSEAHRMTYREKYKNFENYEKAQALRWKSREVQQRDQLYGCIYGDDKVPDELLNKSFPTLMKMYENKVKSIEFLDNIIRGKAHSLLFRHMWDAIADTEVRT